MELPCSSQPFTLWSNEEVGYPSKGKIQMLTLLTDLSCSWHCSHQQAQFFIDLFGYSTMYTGSRSSLCSPNETLITDTLTGSVNTEPAGVSKDQQWSQDKRPSQTQGSACRTSTGLHTQHKQPSDKAETGSY